MDLHQSHKAKKTWKPDTNQCIYTCLIKPKGIPDANQWTYTNLTKQRKTNAISRGNKLPINGLTLDSKEMGCQSMVLVPTPTRS
jgi:hypothetical protein